MARLQGGLLFLATVALIVPSAIGDIDRPGIETTVHDLSIGLSVLLLIAHVLGLVFSLGTHRQFFANAAHDAAHEEEQHLWSVGVALPVPGVITVLVALVSEFFVESVQHAAASFDMTPAFVGFIVVAIVGAAAEMMAAFKAARKNRLDMSVGIALGSSSQIALFVAPVLVLLSLVIAPTAMDLTFWRGAVVMVLVSTLTVLMATNSGRSAWYLGVLLLVVYATFAMALILASPGRRLLNSVAPAASNTKPGTRNRRRGDDDADQDDAGGRDARAVCRDQLCGKRNPGNLGRPGRGQGEELRRCLPRAWGGFPPVHQDHDRSDRGRVPQGLDEEHERPARRLAHGR
jgi:hypothetical protein